MDLSYRRLGVKSSVVAAGSVWETRMKSDEFRGGIKVFNGEDEDEEEENINGDDGDKRLKKGQSVGGSKRKTWKNESFDGFKKNPIKVVAKGRSMEHCKDLSLAVVDNGIKKKSPVQVKKGRSDGNERNPILTRKQRSQVHKRTAKTDSNGNEDLGLDSIEENEKNPVETDKVESETEENNEEHEDKKLPKIDTQVKKSPEEKPNKAINEMKKVHEDKGSNVVNQVKKFSQFHNKTATFSSTMNKQPPPVVKLATSIPTKSKPSSNDDHHYHKFPQTQNKLQNIVDLVMWRDIPKSALIFGIGTFIIISSSYTQDLNISFISVISYMGLVYLSAIFLYRSIICRGVVEIDESNCVVGEEEAIWLLKLVLPYLNEFLLKLRALFSGDPSTTMKMAVLLFVLARCGSSITIWKMAKLGEVSLAFSLFQNSALLILTN
ncbi:Reticulon-like protein B21 [Gossypium arboreum]|uniref:Reticulon-like protein B21 n=1 Tax=Gossypium arboreum TaxID=29729 RepID=A0A0B0NW45_GOSAR|nr:Reticulon-like protein B21 [Gossypium arboreum]